MLYAAIAIAVLALLVALVAASKASGAAKELEDARMEAKRAATNVEEKLQEQLATTRQLIALVAQGAQPTREMILEGQLWRDVDSNEAQQMFARGDLRVIDVRTPQETASGILPGAMLIPVDVLEERMREIPKDGKRTLIYCAGGGRSAAACEFLSGKGFAEMYNLAGGFGSWRGPTVRP